MSILETKRLLRTLRIAPNKLLGQNFMVEPSIFLKLCDYASLGKEDVVLDAGAGFGFLTRFLADKCRSVVAVEKDPRVASVLREKLSGLANVTVVEGDVLKVALPDFNKMVSIPPYYLSSRLVTWLLERKVDCAVLVLQNEFAARLVAAVGTEEYSWLTVITSYGAHAELLDPVPKYMFYPQPAVDSVIVQLEPWKTAPFEVHDEALFKRLVRWLFTQRNKKLSNALVPFIKSTYKTSKEKAVKLAGAVPLRNNRVRELSPNAFGEVANALTD